MCQFQEYIRPLQGIPAGLQSNWEVRWLVQVYDGSDCDMFGNTSERRRQSWKHWPLAWQHLGALAISLGVPATSLEAPSTSLEAAATSLWAQATSLGAQATSLGAQATSLGAPRITVEQSEKNNILFGNAAGAPGNHSYYLSFNDF